jgi:16S rRNA (cytosine1407-C5)-methyltransferase
MTTNEQQSTNSSQQTTNIGQRSISRTHPFSRYRPIIDDWDAFMEMIKRPLPTAIWTNPLKTTPEQLSALLKNANIAHEPIMWYPGGFRLLDNIQPGLRWEYLAGLYHVQEEVSMLPVLFMNIQPGDRALDLCAAPGNKTAQIGVALNNRGTVVANDRNAGRMRAARQTFNRLGLVNITTTTADGANYSKYAGQFDSVLVDVPCSCEGTCRKDKSSLKRPVNPQKLVGMQAALLRKAVYLCKPGGRVVYSTCTFAPEENEMIINAILQQPNNEMHMLPISVPAGFITSPGLTEWDDASFDPSLQHALRIWPHQNDTGGFFVAVLEKESNAKGQRDKERKASSAPASAALSTSLRLCVDQERQPWINIVTERFGIDPTLFDNQCIFRVGKKKVYVVNDDHQPVERPVPDAYGMHFMRVDGRYPKLTTGSATIFGAYATRNRIELTEDQVIDFIARRELSVLADQIQDCTGNGYVMLRYQDAWVGQGALYMDGVNGRVDSMFPKAWSRDLQKA